MLRRLPLRVAAACLFAACAGPTPTTAPLPEILPPPPPAIATGPLALRVAYPPPAVPHAGRSSQVLTIAADSGYAIHSRDSAFIFGTTGRGDATLAVNGRPVEVYPSGGWIAWLPLPDDSVMRFELIAAAAGDTTRLTFVAPIDRGFVPATPVWIDTTAWTPSGARWLVPGEPLTLALHATPGSEVRAIRGADTVRFLVDPGPATPPWGELAFATTPPAPTPLRTDRYVARWVGPLGPDPGLLTAPDSAPPPDDPRWVRVEAILGADTARARWPLRVGFVDPARPPVVVVNDDTAHVGETDSLLAGRPVPYGTYHWFFPTGTVAAVSGRWNGQVRLQLSRRTVAWVDAADVQPLAGGTPPPGGRARAMRLTPGERSVVLRIPLPARIPFRVDEAEREIRVTLYGVAADMDWIQYGGTDSLVRLIDFAQPAADETVVTVQLGRPVWGYRARWDGHDLLLEVRRPPAIDPARPLAGRRIALDAGHPPLGATGPTGVRESDVVLAVAREAQALLEARGATVIMTRRDSGPVALAARPRLAEQADAEVLVSLHANALPDGVNPFVNNGTSVYYFHPRSAPLARHVQRALVAQFGFRDLGMGRGDLALARPTWMPAVLAEGLFMMLPDQEAVLASPEGQRRYARGIVNGIGAFLREWARR